MRKSLILLPLLLTASPALAGQAGEPPATIKVPRELTDPAMADKLAKTMDGLTNALLDLKVGEKLVAKGINDLNVIMKIEKVGSDEVEVRLVHPLAEKDIKYSVEVVNVTDPRPPPMPAAALELEEDK